MDKYEEIIDYEWKGSLHHTKMDVQQRAKIFLPFAALTGYETLLREVDKVINNNEGNSNSLWKPEKAK